MPWQRHCNAVIKQMAVCTVQRGLHNISALPEVQTCALCADVRVNVRGNTNTSPLCTLQFGKTEIYINIILWHFSNIKTGGGMMDGAFALGCKWMFPLNLPLISRNVSLQNAKKKEKKRRIQRSGLCLR